MGIENGTSSGGWKEIAARKHEIQHESIERFLQKFPSVENPDGFDICDLEYAELRELLTRGNIKAEAVTIAYIHKYDVPYCGGRLFAKLLLQTGQSKLTKRYAQPDCSRGDSPAIDKLLDRGSFR